MSLVNGREVDQFARDNAHVCSCCRSYDRSISGAHHDLLSVLRKATRRPSARLKVLVLEGKADLSLRREELSRHMDRDHGVAVEDTSE